MRQLLILPLVLFAFGACAERDPVGVSEGLDDPGLAAFRAAGAASQLTVMTRNMYIGAPVEPILAESDPAMVMVRVAEAWAVLIATDVASRARAMADEIAKARPHLVGLQEVTLLRTQFPGDVVLGNPAPNATEVAFDFLQLLLDELGARGMDYTVAAQIQNVDVEMPRLDGFQGEFPITTDVRLTDFDVILARGDVPTVNAATGNYAVTLPAPAGIEVPRGWTAVDATVRGVTYRFVNTHLEAEAEVIRYFQAQELVGVILAGETKPTILVGDLNTGPGRPADQGGQETYDFLTGLGGFTDAWTTQPHPSNDGFTCCHAGDLSNTMPNLTQRIDLVLTRNLEAFGPSSGNGVAHVWVVGDQLKDLRQAGVWSSDHAGVVAGLVLPKPGVAD